MKIDYTKGIKNNKDRKIWIKTDEQDNEKGEVITIFKLGLLVNQLAINERTIHNIDWDIYPFYFKDFIIQAIEDAIHNIDWAEPENKEYVEKILYKFKLKLENIDYDLLRRTQQRKLKEFEK